MRKGSVIGSKKDQDDLAVRIQTRENSLGSVSVLILLPFFVWEGEGLEEGGVNWRVPTGNARLYTEF